MLRACLLLSLASVVSVWAQSSAGSIVVTAQDSSGALIPGAAVTATNEVTIVTIEYRRCAVTATASQPRLLGEPSP